MTSAVSTRSADNSARWWSLNKTNSASSTSTLTSLATAMGFKSKKHSMAIQQPPLTVRPIITSPLPPNSEPATRPRLSSKTTSRPASKSVSSTRSRGDSIGPKTPVDNPPSWHRQSLLTLSDIDPFAARITLQHSSSDPNRLSAYSVPSSPDYIPKKTDPIINRGSYASSSSHHTSEISPLSSPTSEVPPLLPEKRRKPFIGSDSHLAPAGLTKSSSSTTLTDSNRLSHPDPAPKPRPLMRARGMTDGGSGVHPRFFRDEPPLPISVPSSPKGVIRAPSTRLNGPTTAPPSQELPRPPIVELDETNSSGISFTLSGRELSRANVMGTDSPDPAYNSLPSRSIKKAVSQQSLSKQIASSTSTPVSDLPTDKSLRKQRSFHHPRIPLPSIPLTFNSYPDVPVPDSRRSSTVTNPSPGRKRLFSSSSSRLPSSPNAEDDARSIFSLRSDSHVRNLNSSTSNIVTVPPSFWDDGQVTPSSPEWQPQQIMSPADMARLEARMETEQLHRKRGMSVLSSSTTASDRDHFILDSGKVPTRTSSLLAAKPSSSKTQPTRPSTSASTSSPSLFSAAQPEHAMISLAPPPRSWQRPSTSSDVQPLSPPPRRLRSKLSAENPLPVDKAMHRRSIMRKPSFLDIDDERDTDPEEGVIAPAPGARRILEDSFLDLARESFDTVRSSEEA